MAKRQKLSKAASSRKRGPDGRFLTGLGGASAESVRRDYGGGDPSGHMMMELGVPGFKQQAGIVTEEYDQKLRGRKKYRKYEEMIRNSPMISTADRFNRVLVEQTDWTDKPPEGLEEDPEALALAKWFTDMRSDMEHGWTTFLSEAMDIIGWGWKWHEIVLKKRRGDTDSKQLRSKFNDGLWGVRKLMPIHHASKERWVFDEDDDVLGMIQRVETRGGVAVIPAAKCLRLQMSDRNSNPEPEGLLRASYRPYHYEEKETEIEAIGLSRNMAGYPQARVPWQALSPNAPPDLAALATAAKKMVREVHANQLAGVVYPSSEDRQGKTGFEFDLLKSSGKNSADTDTPIRRHRQDIAMIWLVQVVLLGSGPTGSWALASSFTEMVALALRAVLRRISEIVREQLYVRIARLNGFPLEKVPVPCFSDIEKEDIAPLFSALTAAVGADIIRPDDPLEEWARTKLDAPVRDAATERRGGVGSAPMQAPMDARAVVEALQTTLPGM